MYKIEIKNAPENLKRISIFLDNNHIKHNVIDDAEKNYEIEEIAESIPWPF
jgi:hypothetical protein